jgi:hypothetical protein
MKTLKTKIIGTGIAMAIALSAWLPSNLGAADNHSDMKGGEHLMSLNKIATKAESEALKPGDSIAMVCTKCKSVSVQNVTSEKGHIKLMTVGEKHACSGCNSVITVIGIGKGATTELKHSCGKCGDTSAFCCATKPGSKGTEGMDKQKQ